MMYFSDCHFDMDTNRVEATLPDGNHLSIDVLAVENEFADNMYQRSELDYLIYNDPASYADLILNGDVAQYLKDVTQYNPFEN